MRILLIGAITVWGTLFVLCLGLAVFGSEPTEVWRLGAAYSAACLLMYFGSGVDWNAPAFGPARQTAACAEARLAQAREALARAREKTRLLNVWVWALVMLAFGYADLRHGLDEGNELDLVSGGGLTAWGLAATAIVAYQSLRLLRQGGQA